MRCDKQALLLSGRHSALRERRPWIAKELDLSADEEKWRLMSLIDIVEMYSIQRYAA
jgi:hypothetical protein